MQINPKTLLKENWGFLLFIFIMFASRSSFADWYHVPSGSMLPTIEVGDRIFVNKMAYQVELPFTDIPLLKTGNVARGDIVVFKSAAAGNRLVKRVIGLPGDQISMVNNQLILNGEVLSYHIDPDTESLHEDLAGFVHFVQFIDVSSSRHSFGNINVPEDHFFVMGDNRNNSQDSRFFGFVPSHELQGKATGVVASFDSSNFYLPKSGRNFIGLQ